MFSTWFYISSSYFQSFTSRPQLGWRFWVCSLVLTTSIGLVIMPATPPAIPAHTNYQKCGFCLSQGLINVFAFSLTQTTTEEKGMFIKTVIGYDRYRPLIPSFCMMFLIVYRAVRFLQSCIRCFRTSLGVRKKSCAKVVDAPIIRFLNTSNSSFFIDIESLRSSYTPNYAAWAGMHPDATTFAPFQNLSVPSSRQRILPVLKNVKLDPLACMWVLMVSTG